MVGIYEDSFLKHLEDFLGEKPKVSNKNIVVPCPFCQEQRQKKKHYHLYISLDAPVFHCFHSVCNTSGSISKLLKKLEGIDTSEKYIDIEKIKKIQSSKINLLKPSEKKVKIFLPNLKEDQFKLKTLYLKGRLKYAVQNLNSLKGLIFDSEEFIVKNNIKVNDELSRVRPYLQSNFIGFLTNNESVVVFRNIDEKSDFKFFKLFIEPTTFLDYYMLYGGNYNSNHVVLAEGIFDIYNEQIFDYTKLKKDVKLYAAALTTSYDRLIKSIVFHEKIYKVDVTILSDRGIDLNFYLKIKKKNNHVINKMDIFYNKSAKDFGENCVSIEKFIL